MHEPVTAFTRMKAKYDKAGTPYQIRTRPYYSSAALVFNYLNAISVGGVSRAFAVAPASAFNEFTMFGYGKGATITLGWNIPRPAGDDDTNQAQPYKTNSEDMIIEGFAFRPRGYRVQYSQAQIDAMIAAGVSDANIIYALQGLTVITDPGSVVVPPEFSSPLVLEDAIWQAAAPKLSLTPQFDRKDSDLIGTGDEFPEAGANSLLRGNGEPTHSNFCRIPEGLTWEKESGDRDTLFSVNLRLIEPVVVAVTQPQGYQGLTPTALGNPQLLFSEFKLKAMGRAFYQPGQNIS